MVGFSHLQGRLDGLAAAIHEEAARACAGRGNRGQLSGQINHGQAGEAEGADVANLVQLGSHGLDDLSAPIAGIHRKQASQCINIFIAVLIPYVGAFAAHEDTRACVGALKFRHLRKV